jgi:SAM-dependent methyltransferase
MPDLFDMRARAIRRDRAARVGPELFLYDRAFGDCVERLELMQQRFDRALMVGCPDPGWLKRLECVSGRTDVRDPGEIFATSAGGSVLIEDAWLPPESAYDLVIAIGTLDTVNNLPLALRLIAHSLRTGGLLIGAMAGGETLPRLREAMRAADLTPGGAAPHVHPRIEPSALAPLLGDAGFINPVVDIDRIKLSYPSLNDLIRDLRGMGVTNALVGRPRFIGKAGRSAAMQNFASAPHEDRTLETVEIIHFAGWRPDKPAKPLTV